MPQTIVKTKEGKKRKIKQPYLAVAFLLVNLAICYFLFLLKPYLPGIWIFGMGFGYVLQRSRFCFAASFRDLIVLKNSALMRAVIIAMIISTIGFFLLQVLYFGQDRFAGQVFPAGFHTALGAFFFGLGMVIAGGCASGVLMRMGEGYLMQWLAFAGMVIGSIVGSMSFGFWEKVFIDSSPTIYLPDLFGWTGGFLIQIAVLMLLYFLFRKYID